MRRILILTTGGTIASVQSPDGLIPSMSSEELMSFMPSIGKDIQLDILPLFHIDSTDMQPEHWLTILRAVRDHYEEFDGFVICHGTDTMAHTAAVLSYLIQDSDRPVVLTGAQKPIGFEITDAKSNLSDGILFAADPDSRGVQIVFAGKVIAGTRARKVRSMSYAAFASINLPEIAQINNGHIIRFLTDATFCGKHRGPQGEDPVRFCDEIDPNVFLLKLTPGQRPELIPEIFRLYDAVLIESFGAGGIPESLRKTLFAEMRRYQPEEKVVAFATQVTYEGSRLETYEVGRRITDSFQILEAKDMTIEAAMAKLMWILGRKGRSWDEIRELFYTPVARDILNEQKA